MFPMSSQKLHWIFSDESDITILREKTNAQFVDKHGSSIPVSIFFNRHIFNKFVNNIYQTLDFYSKFHSNLFSRSFGIQDTKFSVNTRIHVWKCLRNNCVSDKLNSQVADNFSFHNKESNRHSVILSWLENRMKMNGY